MGLKSCTPFYDIFVGRCTIDTVENDLIDYCKQSGITVDNSKCVLIESKSTHTKAFKLTVNDRDRQEMLKSEFWPEGIIVRKFYKPKSDKNEREGINSSK